MNEGAFPTAFDEDAAAIDAEKLRHRRAQLLGSFLLFTQVFYKLRTGRDFKISEPIGRESHHITIAKELTKVFYGETSRLLINIPPGHGKSELVKHFVAWAMAHYPDCNFLYISVSSDLATKHTAHIKQIMELPEYRKTFGVILDPSSSAKDNFKTTKGGTVRAYGSSGTIVGQDAGLPNVNRFSGAVLMDDMHKPDEVHSDNIREHVITNYNETIKIRTRSPTVPYVFIGQRLHEADVAQFFIDKKDGYDWKKVILPCVDAVGNILDPALMPREKVEIESTVNEYVWASQYQQNPIPSGGGIFKKDDFMLLDEEPKILATFITADTAETTDKYNDFTVFSFWGIYKVKNAYVELDEYALHWLDCYEFKCEPRFLEGEFMQFYADCMRHTVKPKLIAIEKKSTGVTLVSVLKGMQGMQVLDVERTAASGNKADRFLQMQSFVGKKLITLPLLKRHTQRVVEHMTKITANNSHRHDDIADTAYDAVKIALIDKSIQLFNNESAQEADKIVDDFAQHFNKIRQARGAALCPQR